MPTSPSPGCATARERARPTAAAPAGACLLACAVAGAGIAAEAPAISPARDAAAAGMVEVRDLAPDIDVRMRYAGADNFTGAPAAGYEANRCYLLHPAAAALARVQASLRAEGLGLVVYDCYRPVRAVHGFMEWAAAADDPAQKARWYPNVDKAALVPGYIAETSGHSRGATVDLTLARCGGGDCEPLDMGTPFDLFDPRAHTDAAAVDPAQRANRQRLRAAMAAQGLRNYPMEWWHYTFQPEPDPGTAYDFPVR